MRRGYWLNQFCMSLMKAENRERFKANERAYLDEWPMSEEQKQAVLARDLTAASSWAATSTFSPGSARPTARASSTWRRSMTGMTQEEYADMMMRDGGRSPEGNR